MFYEGRQIGGYTLLRKLGKGGFGEVWLAEKRSQFVTKKVAVKLPLDEQVNLDAIRQEAELWEQASGHPNVLPIIDADIIDGQVVIVSEYAEGGSLADRLKRDGQLPLQKAVEMTIGILSGLEFLHSRKIIHRDIKPQNILLQGDTPRLADFGISRAMNTTVISSAIIGTDAYMSPESFDGKRTVQTDIWSVGVVLYALLADRLPFPQEHPSERMFAILTKEFAPLPPDVPQNIQRIVYKALAKQPESRYQTTAEMRDELQKALISITHPTFAPTEVLIKPDLKDFESNALTITAEPPTVQNPAPAVAEQTLTDATEIRTVAGSAPINEPPIVNRHSLNEPAPTAASYPQNSVVTEIKEVPAAANQPVFDASLLNKSVETQPSKRKLYFGLIGGSIFVLLLAVLAGYKLMPDNRTELEKQIDQVKEKDPYYVYTDAFYFEENKKYGFKNSNNEIIIPAKYDFAAPQFNEGVTLVKMNGKYGYIDIKDNLVIPLKFENAHYFTEGLAWVVFNGKYRFINHKGEFVFPQEFDEAQEFASGLAPVKSNDKWGFIDHNGTVAVPFKYGYAYYFYNDIAMVCLKSTETGSCGIIDKTGRELTPLKYDSVGIASDGMVSVSLNGLSGFVDTTGKERIPPKYRAYASAFFNGYTTIELNGRKIRLDKDGNETDLGPADAAPPGSMSFNTNMAAH
jgi:serine/threonine protein kinase